MNYLPPKELRDLVKAFITLEQGDQLVLATVISTEGSTYRKAGARMLIGRSGWIAGSVSGGCLEGDLVSSAWSKTEQGPALVTYDSSSDDDIVWGFGLGCNGVVHLLLERIGPNSPIVEAMIKVITEGAALRVSTDYTPGPNLGRRSIVPLRLSDEAEIGDEILSPPKRIAIFGAGFDAVPLVKICRELGWSVVLIDNRSVDQTRFGEVDKVVSRPFKMVEVRDFAPCDAAVLMSHHYLNDLQALSLIASTDCSYIGMLGPRVRTNRILRELGIATDDRRIHSPIGLAIGAQGPHEIALAIAAEIQGALARTIDRAPNRNAALFPAERPLCGL